jgi:photosystem II stability/assembly factor-like uncharacterized protein
MQVRLAALATAALAVLATAPPYAGTSAAAPACRNDTETRRAWHALALPDGATTGAELDDEPCVLLAAGSDGRVWHTSDGGDTWQGPVRLGAATQRVLTEGMPPRSALVTAPAVTPAGGPGGWVTHDAGVTFRPVSGLDGRDVVAVTGSGTVGLVYALAAPVVADAPGPTLFRSDDFGNSFTPVATAAFAPVAAVAVPGSATDVWAASAGPAAALWHTTDGGTSWQQVRTGAVTDLAAARISDGAATVVAATPDGLVRSDDGGTTWVPSLTGTPVDAVRVEYDHAGALMLLSRGRVLRVTAGHPRDAGEGLPAGCRPDGLRADHQEPSTFFVSCASGTYRYRTDGADLDGIGDASPGGPGNQGYVGVKFTDMRVLRELKRPASMPADGSGSLAFDGRQFYFADSGGAGVVNRMDLAGRMLPDLVFPIDKHLLLVMYDANRELLYVVDGDGTVYAADPRTMRTHVMFHSPVWSHTVTASGVGTLSYDATTERFRGAVDGGKTLVELDRHGHETSHCDVPVTQSPDPDGVSEHTGSTGADSVIGTGDGGAYVQFEDDTTVVRLNRSCAILAPYTHRRFSEATRENTALACDTTTFPVAAMWIRDADTNAIWAYEVPGGYCAVDSILAIDVARSVTVSGTTPVCAGLHRAGRGDPLPGQQVALFAAGLPLGTATTDAAGRACLPLSPAALGLPASARGVRVPLLATFLGTPAYRPSSARASTLVTTVPPAPLPPPPRPPVRALLPLLPVLPAVPPVPPAAPLAMHAPAPQPQPQPQPNAQPGSVSQAGLVAAPGENVEVATAAQHDDEPGAGLLAMSALMAAAAVAYEQRRRAAAAAGATR